VLVKQYDLENSRYVRQDLNRGYILKILSKILGKENISKSTFPKSVLGSSSIR